MPMKLLTKAIEAQLLKHPLYSTDGQNVAEILVKFFNPTGSGTWYAVEAEKLDNGDWRFFGLVDLHEKELGYFMFSELRDYRGRFGLGIERDLYFENRVLDKEAMEVVAMKNCHRSNHARS